MLSGSASSAPVGAEQAFQRPYVISWNLTYRCNLQCEHCYLDAGPSPQVESEAFTDRSELDTSECKRVVDDIVSFAPEAVTILTGGEPLLRRDILDIVRYAASKNLWVVVGTNGVLVTERLALTLKEAGVRGLALSLDSLDPAEHDRFRGVRGAWRNTVEGARVLNQAGLPFIVQTTVGKHNQSHLGKIADFAQRELAAKVWNLYFLVTTGRGVFVSDIAPAEYDGVLEELYEIQKIQQGKMMVNAKCAPHYVKTLFEHDPDSPLLKSYSGGAGGCPAGTHYMGIRPNGDVTPCPYLPVFGGNLRQDRLRDVWESSEPFVRIRKRDELGGRCGECELASACGGCRARAYGSSGDYLAEDALCTHQPGTVPDAYARLRAEVEYGTPESRELDWEPAARERMHAIPAFVRGMVVRAVEESCRKRGLGRVTCAELDEIRSRMPANRLFGKRG
ncbi:MAG: radical SAM protein [Acidobacteria bacterium]|nr:radical SAM protein [Acidobacteriota bacterium]